MTAALFDGQRVIPAAKTIKEYEQLLDSPHPFIILLQTHLAQLDPLLKLARRQGKKVLLHADMIQGLKHDEAAAQFLCQYMRPYGLISTHASVLSVAKKHRLVTIQRMFLLDSQSLSTSLRLLTSAMPDFIEVIPGVLTDVIAEIKTKTQVPLLAGGFIRTPEDVHKALKAGATAVTTSRKELWDRDWSTLDA
ncbi:MAG: glycerol-3-phosphate responsive antiterminator [Alicyclobacillus herbarius]|uniref:glycerol-3-phosphate responsive antiterminator n=1 Tax=Alicyclobacillus herbarius TaxID=122960 RepID=UPI002354628B|nr:glycerol-3-phosphate responsive antiterminator [Alicyclobacillus herbarius]MCL6632498.1 glycerol-3-phosphate responsive antiterminator [Alicyclobacillus herbarius]